MSELPRGTSAAELRRAFDRSFAEAPVTGGAGVEELLALSIGGDAYLLPLAELAGLAADKRIVALPTTVRQFLGVVGIRGTVVPAFDLAAMLGYPPTDARPRWIALARTPRVGLAFAAMTGQLRRPRAETPSAGERSDRAHVREAVRIDDVVHRIIDVSSVLATIATKEQG